MRAKPLGILIVICIVVGTILTVMCAWGYYQIVKIQIQKNIQIDESSKMYEKWRKLPMPLDFKVYVFKVTNADEINKGEKPILEEVGPYVYKEYRERTILGYGEHDTIKYTVKKTFVFNQEESGELSEDDEVTVINFSYMGALLSVVDMMPAFVPMVNKALEQFFGTLDDAFMRVKVKDLLFDGIFLNCEGDNSALGLVCGKIKMDAPPTMRPSDDGKGYYFSMFGHMNRSQSGVFEIKRGRENVYELGHIVSYNNNSVMPNWGDKYCGQINGTDSTIFPPINKNNVPDKLYSFEPDICRSLYISQAGKKEILNISTHYYEISESALAAKTANPDNKCFCRKNWSGNHDGCLMMGLLNLQPCQGAPAIASLPHFYLGSEELLEYIGKGLNPDKEKHNTYVYLEPMTGVPIQGLKRLQFNIELRRMSDVPQLQKVPTGLFPLLWIEEGAQIPASIQDELRHSITLILIGEVTVWFIMLGCVVVTLIGGMYFSHINSVIKWPMNNSVSFILSPTPLNMNSNKIN